MPELHAAPLRDVHAAVTARRDPPVGGEYWAVLVLAGTMFAGAFLGDITALGATDWDWHAHPLLAAWYAVLILCGFAMQLVVCAWTAQQFVMCTISTGRGVRRAAAVVSDYTRRL